MMTLKDTKKSLNKKRLKKLYQKGLSQKEIAKKLKTTCRKVQYWMQKYQLPTRAPGETRKLQTQRLGRRRQGPRKTLPKDVLIEHYVNQGLSIAATAKLNGWSWNLVKRELSRHNIHIRTQAETLKLVFNQPHIRKRRSNRTKGEKNPMFGKFGSQHGAWKPPKKHKTPLYKAIRFCSEYKQWRSTVFQRDGFVCQFCEKKGGNINADHLTPLAILIADNQICSLDEARKCSALWDIENGQTLCVPCHKKTNTYGQQLSQYKRSKIGKL